MPTGSFTINAIIGYPGGIRHKRIVGKDQGTDATQVQPRDWHEDHIDVPVYDFTEANTSFTLATGGTVISRTITLKAGTYRVSALIRTSTMTVAGNPGSLYLRKDSTQLTNGVYVDMRPTADTTFILFGIFTHTGGSTTIDAYYSWEAGTTRFGVNGTTEARFGQKLLIERIGD